MYRNGEGMGELCENAHLGDVYRDFIVSGRFLQRAVCSFKVKIQLPESVKNIICTVCMDGWI